MIGKEMRKVWGSRKCFVGGNTDKSSGELYAKHGKLSRQKITSSIQNVARLTDFKKIFNVKLFAVQTVSQ